MKRPKPDMRPDWRDPDMPCERDYLLRDGRRLNSVTPEWEQQFREHLMQTVLAPDWRNDPTYNLRKPNAKAKA